MTKTILLAGATGKTGRLLARNLLDRGHSVTALVREGSDTSVLPDEVTLQTADLTDLPADTCTGADVAHVLADAVSGKYDGKALDMQSA